MTFILSLLLLTLVLMVFAYQIGLYNSVVSDRFRFEYFALRDRLNLLVVEGKLREESPEYQTLMNALNFHIHAIERVSIIRMASLIADFYTSSNGSQAVKINHQRLQSDDTKKLMLDFLSTTEKVLRRNSRAQMRLFRFIAKRNIRSPTHKVGLHVSRPQAALDLIRQNKKEISSALPDGLICA